MSVFRTVGILTLAALAVGCAPHESPAAADADAETAALAPLRAQYDDTVTGFDVSGTTVKVALDLQKYDYMDPDAMPDFRRAVAARWRSVWAARHPHEHALLTVHFIDYFGKTVATETTRI